MSHHHIAVSKKCRGHIITCLWTLAMLIGGAIVVRNSTVDVNEVDWINTKPLSPGCAPPFIIRHEEQEDESGLPPPRNSSSFPNNNKSLTVATMMNRWDKRFHELFDVRNSLYQLIGPPQPRFKDKYVIYRCDNHTMSGCGGWADRVRGMMTAYLIANLSGRVFKAEMIMPDCDLQKFVVPNQVNWSLPVPFHKQVYINDKVKVLDMWAQPAYYETFRNTDWANHPKMSSDFLYMKSNHDNMDNFRESLVHSKELQWMQGANRAFLNRFIFTHLFRPSPYLWNRITSFLKRHVEPDEKLVCVHLRMGKNPTMPQDFRDSVNFEYLTDVWKLVRNLMSQQNDRAKVFVMSDSKEAINDCIRQGFASKLLLSHGDIIHMELSPNISDKQRCDGFEKVIFEEMVLFHCDSLIITDSGISRMAAYVRGTNKDLYCLTLSGVLVNCTMSQLKNDIYYTRN